MVSGSLSTTLNNVVIAVEEIPCVLKFPVNETLAGRGGGGIST